ncbi:hypothetical protein [Leucobacter ruminantium]|uniref:Uncharacterized protein n=1 Tax=Leucobacter ruminantium TaxID=1289170 RepID=A0A939RVM3_9MICO|nr:hypothetical protein [Leucobacter ruminantium]MBO1804112.1 hypothetical protein [Leucobacter ruminantium]
MNDGREAGNGDAEELGRPGSDVTATTATILAEVRDTAPTASREQVAEMIRSRLDREGISLRERDIADLVAQIVDGDESAG